MIQYTVNVRINLQTISIQILLTLISMETLYELFYNYEFFIRINILIDNNLINLLFATKKYLSFKILKNIFCYVHRF